jgi:hypothetical protein
MSKEKMQTAASSTVKDKIPNHHDSVITNPRRAPKSRGGCQRCKAKRVGFQKQLPGLITDNSLAQM